MGYALMGSICYSVMISLGEMIAFLPLPGGHIKLAERFVDPALSFAIGWNYVVSPWSTISSGIGIERDPLTRMP